MNTAAPPTRPALRYHGGKWRLAPWIIQHLPPHRVYVEPYGGAAGVLLRKKRAYSEVYNDLSGDVVNLFRLLRNPVTRAELCEAVAMTPYARAEFVESYHQREAWIEDDIERARRLLIRSHMGFGSAGASRQHRTGFRSNVLRSSTTPAHDWAGLPGVLARVGERLRGVLIEQDTALAVIERYDSDETLYYVDPPYVLSERNSSGAVYEHEMTDAQHEHLAEALHSVAGSVVLSGYACSLYQRLFAGWTCLSKEVAAQGPSGSVARTECLWLNPRAAAARPSLFDLPA